MPDPSSLYPQPPAPGGGSLLAQNPLQLVGAIGALNQNALFQQEFAARKAVGEAYQSAIDPRTGQIDTPTLMREIQARPAASFLAGDAAAGALARQGQQISNATGAFNLRAAQNQFLTTAISTLANKDQVTPDDVNSFIATAARNTQIPSDMLLNWQRILLADPKNIKAKLPTIANLALGNASLEPGATIGYTQQGAPIAGTRGQAINAATAPAAGAPQPIVPGAAAAPGPQAGIAAPPPGQVEAATRIGAASADASNVLRAAADSSMVRKGMLGNLEDDLQNFTSGPGADWTKFAKAWVNRNIPLPAGWQFDPKSIASQEQFMKQAVQLVQSQFATIGGTGTDAKFNSAYETSPTDALSPLGNRGIIRLLKGNEDAIQAKQRAWLNWRHQFGPQTYDEFSQDFNSRFDPRTFQFKYLTPQERQSYIDHMDPRDRQQFINALTNAHKQGWIRFEDR
jgi:hypothetical protein